MRYLMSAALAAAATFALAPAHAEVPDQPSSVSATEGYSHFTVEVFGEGADVVLIPGLSSPREVWLPTAELLKSRYRIHLVELRGFGGDEPGANAQGPVLEPMVAELHAYLEAHTRGGAAIIGHSMGGLTALLLAERGGPSVAKAMVVDALPFFSVLMDPQATAESVAPQASMMRQTMIAGGAAFRPRPRDCSAIEDTDAPPVGNMTNTQAGLCKVTNWVAAADVSATANYMHDVMITDMRARIASIAIPLTVVYGRDERLLPHARFDEIYRSNYAANPATRFAPVDRSFHFVMLDQPEATLAAIEDFLEAQ